MGHVTIERASSRVRTRGIEENSAREKPRELAERDKLRQGKTDRAGIPPVVTAADRIAVARGVPRNIRRLDGIDKEDFDFSYRTSCRLHSRLLREFFLPLFGEAK